MYAGKKSALIMGAGLLLGSAHVTAAPTATMLDDTCAGCHGTDGVSTGQATPSLP